MRKTITLLWLLAGILFSRTSFASHAMGGEITYTWISGNTYEVQFNFYRDCAGIPAPAVVTANAASGCFAALSVPLQPTATSPQQIAPVCAGMITTCNGGTMNGIEKWTYTGTVTLTGSCADWTFSVSECCRNSAITNLSNPGGESAYFSAMLNNLAVPFNSSVKMASDPVPYLFSGRMNAYNNGAFDIENDSIAVTLVDALSAPGTSVTYQTGFSGTNPVTSAPAMTIDPSNGNILVTPVSPEVDVIAYRIEEYRNGVLVGYVTRDIQITILSNANNLPYLNGISGTPNMYTINACEHDTATFVLSSFDADSLQNTNIELMTGLNSWAVGLSHQPVTLSTGAQRDALTVTIVADSLFPANGLPYIFYFKVNDDDCPYYGSQTYAISLYVNGCSSDVWPGDANDDLSCNLYDLLPIGIAYNQTGPARPGASLNWSAQAASNWNGALASGVNYKFADCNGDGIIDAADTSAINLNFGNNHPPRLSQPSVVTTAPELKLNATATAAGANDQFVVNVQMGSTANVAAGVYGVAFRITFDPTLFNPSTSSFHFLPGQLGTPGSDLLTMSRIDWNNGVVYAAAVRMDGTPQNVSGTIASFEAHVISNVISTSSSIFNIDAIEGVNENGNQILFSPVNDTVSIVAGTTGILYGSNTTVRLYPNPANDVLRIDGIREFSSVTITDLSGKSLLVSENQLMDVRSLAAGTYFAVIEAAGTKSRIRFNVMH